jgi:hypothetical protein
MEYAKTEYAAKNIRNAALYNIFIFVSLYRFRILVGKRQTVPIFAAKISNNMNTRKSIVI